MWCPIILGLSMHPFSAEYPGLPHNCQLRSITVKAGASRTHNIWVPKGHSSISTVLFWSKKVPSQPRFRGGDTDFIYSACREKRVAAGYPWRFFYCMHSVSSHHLIFFILPNTVRCIFKLIQYIWHELVVVNESCLCPAPNFIVWLSLHPGINLCASNILCLAV